MKPIGWLFVFSFIALLFGFTVWLSLEFQHDSIEQERIPAPDFLLKNEWTPYLKAFENHLDGISDLSAIIRKIESMGLGTWIIDLEDGIAFVCPFRKEFEDLKTVILIETGERGESTKKTVNFFGSQVTVLEKVSYSLFSLEYKPAYAVVDSVKYKELIETGYKFEIVEDIEEINSGKFVDEVINGKGPVVIKDSDEIISEELAIVLEYYKLKPEEIRYFFKR